MQASARREGDSNPRALWAKAFQVREPLSVEYGEVGLSWIFGNSPSAQQALVGPIWPEIMDRIMDWNGAASVISVLSSIGYPSDVAPQDQIGDTPLLDEWLAEVGEDAVAEAVAEARRSITDGKTPGFSDKDEFLKYLCRQHRHTA